MADPRFGETLNRTFFTGPDGLQIKRLVQEWQDNHNQDKLLIAALTQSAKRDTRTHRVAFPRRMPEMMVC